MKNGHECFIGMLHDYDNTDLITLKQLKSHIKSEKSMRENPNSKIVFPSKYKPFELSDYCDKRKNTDITRFEYCPICGKKIDWKSIKKSENNT